MAETGDDLDAKSEQEALLAFWLAQPKEKLFTSDPDFDEELRRRFGSLQEAAAEGALDAWRETARGCLALIILLDQLTRNFHRGTPRAFENDAKALALSKQALARGYDAELKESERSFLYMPFEHSEDIAEQERGVELMAGLTSDPAWHRFAEMHRDVIARFGRFPHRNAILGRASTAEELAFLKEPNSSF